MNARAPVVAIALALLLPLQAAAQGLYGLAAEGEGFAEVPEGAPFDFPADHGPHPGLPHRVVVRDGQPARRGRARLRRAVDALPLRARPRRHRRGLDDAADLDGPHGRDDARAALPRPAHGPRRDRAGRRRGRALRGLDRRVVDGGADPVGRPAHRGGRGGGLRPVARGHGALRRPRRSGDVREGLHRAGLALLLAALLSRWRGR